MNFELSMVERKRTYDLLLDLRSELSISSFQVSFPTITRVMTRCMYEVSGLSFHATCKAGRQELRK